jgi:hypothetical protein
MGFFKTIKNANRMAAQGMKMKEHYEGQAAAANQPVDLNDPKWAPIHGVDVDKYAEISAGLQKHSVAGPENVAKFAEEQGVPEGKWQEVQVGWTQRMQQHEPVRLRYGNLYSKFLS